MRYRAIYKLWPDFPVYSQIYRSVATIKSDAAVKSYGAGGFGIVWAVIDSGIDRDHPHFDTESGHTLLSPEVQDLHRCFVEAKGTFQGWTFRSWRRRHRIRMRCRRPELRAHRRSIRNIGTTRKASWMTIGAWRLTDDFGHGTHVAGIIAGGARKGTEVRLLERTERSTRGASWSAGSSS